MRIFLFIILFFGMVVLAGCRANLKTSGYKQRERVDEIGVELHRVDSLWGSRAENLTYRIEFFPNTCTDVSDTLQGDAGCAAGSLGPIVLSGGTAPAFGRQGQIKSIEVSVEKTEGGSAVFKTDTTYNSQSSSKEIKHTANDSEARQDNGAVAIVSVVLAAAALCFLMIVLNKLKL